MPSWFRFTAAGKQWLKSDALAAVIFGVTVMSSCATVAESLAMSEPKERWQFTTKGHFSWYALLTGAPIYRDQIRAVFVADDRIYLTIALSGGRSQVLALERSHGRMVWETRLSIEGWPVRGGFVQVGERLVTAVFQEKTKELIAVGLDPKNGTTAWQTSLPNYQQPGVYEIVLDPDVQNNTVNIYQLRTKARNRIVLRVKDGSRVTETSYDGYIWPSGSRRAEGLVFGFEGTPELLSTTKYQRFLAFDENTGQLAWELPLSRPWTSPPAAVAGSIVFTAGSQLLRVDLKSGRPIWTVNMDGYRPVEPEAPVVIGSRIAVPHTASRSPEDKEWKLSVHRLSDGSLENTVLLQRSDSETFSVVRRMGNFVIVGSYLVLQVLDLKNIKVVATVDFKKMFSWFIYSDPPSMHVAVGDDQGFVVTTTDGRVRYYSAQDFQ